MQSHGSIATDIERVLGDVRATVLDWRKMVSRAEECLNELEINRPI